MSTKVTNTTAIIDGTVAVVNGMNALLEKADDPSSVAEAVRDIMLMAGITRLALFSARQSPLVEAGAIDKADAIVNAFIANARGLCEGEEE